MSAAKPNREKRLTPRECEVMDLLATGLTPRAIGQELQCAEGTVKKHLQQSYRTLESRNRLRRWSYG